MKNKYFMTADSIRCFDKDTFISHMKANNIRNLAVYKSEKVKIKGLFWCNKMKIDGETNNNTCGYDWCEFYEPRNKKSGCCRHYSLNFYSRSNKQITFTV